MVYNIYSQVPQAYSLVRQEMEEDMPISSEYPPILTKSIAERSSFI